MSQHLIDTKVKLATCNRCSAYVWFCTVSGFKVMADPRPLSLDEYREALCARRSTYRILTVAGRPDTLQMLSAASQRLQEATIVADHSCGVRSMNATRAEAVEVPTSPPVRSTAATGGQLQNPAPESLRGPPQSSVARYAKAFRFDAPTCDTCHKPIGEHEEYVGVEFGGKWMWAMHCEEK